MEYLAKITLSILALLLLGACSTSPREFRHENREALLGLTMGASKQDVLEAFGYQRRPLTPRNSELLANPYYSERISYDDVKYEILYFYTQNKDNSPAITSAELTPIIFSDVSGDTRVVGWGWTFLPYILPDYPQYSPEATGLPEP